MSQLKRTPKQVPDRLSIYYMNDNFTFSRIHGITTGELLQNAEQLVKTRPWGAICPVIICNGDKELRRVGPMVHHNPNHAAKWAADKAKWEEALKQDADVMQLLKQNPQHQIYKDD